MITKTFKITLASKTKREMQKDIDYLERTFGAEEVETGKWQWHKCTILDEEMHAWFCSQCGFMATGIAIDNARYCPNCGSKMQIEEE